MVLDLSIVIPVYNGAATIKLVCEELIGHLTSQNISYEIILINDCSKDNSWYVIQKLSHKHNCINGVDLQSNMGQQNATYIGMKQAVGQYILTMDDDGQHDPRDVVSLFNVISDNKFDLVYGIPDQKQHKSYRHIGTMLTDLFFTVILKKNVRIKISSFRIFHSKLVQDIKINDGDFLYVSAELLKQKPRVANMTMAHRKRLEGKSNYTIKKLLQLYGKLVITYTPLMNLRGNGRRRG